MESKHPALFATMGDVLKTVKPELTFGFDQILKVEGISSIEEFCEVYICDSVVPGVCTKCGYVKGLEPDASSGWCDECDASTMVGGLRLLGML